MWQVFKIRIFKERRFSTAVQWWENWWVEKMDNKVPSQLITDTELNVKPHWVQPQPARTEGIPLAEQKFQLDHTRSTSPVVEFTWKAMVWKLYKIVTTSSQYYCTCVSSNLFQILHPMSISFAVLENATISTYVLV